MASPCSLCNAECCRNHYITVTAFDIQRIAGKTGRRPEDFAVLYPLRLLNFDNDTVIELHDNGFPEEHLLCLKSQPCVFLEGKRCSIHDFAPYVCRTYPKQVNGKVNLRLCPFPANLLFRIFGTNMPEGYVRELEEYKNIVAEWNRKKGKKKDCLDFLLSRTHSPL